MSQQFESATRAGDEEPAKYNQAQKAAVSIDELLDEIDLVLEADAQKFVQGFVQKGGE